MVDRPPRSGRRVLALAAAFLLPVIIGCGARETPAAEQTPNVALLQENKYVTARLYGVMTFAFSGTTYTAPTELTISSVPVVWMGQVFNGKVVGAGPGRQIGELVHGGVSPDGVWLLSFSYSRQVSRADGSGAYYYVELKNVPIARILGGVISEPGSFEKEGDIQKYVQKIEYRAGGLGISGVDDGTYMYTDWANTSEGERPSLKVIFEKEPSQALPGESREIPAGGGM